MSDQCQDEKIDKILEALSKPVNKLILAILIGVSPDEIEDPDK